MKQKQLIFGMLAALSLSACDMLDISGKDSLTAETTPPVQTTEAPVADAAGAETLVIPIPKASGVYGQYLATALVAPQLPLQSKALHNRMQAVRRVSPNAWASSWGERMVASLQKDPAFVAAVQKLISTEGAGIGDKLLKNPALAGQLPQANVLFAQALKPIAEDTAALKTAATAYKNAAYKRHEALKVPPPRAINTPLPWNLYTSKKGGASVAERVIAVAIARMAGVPAAKTTAILEHPAVTQCLRGVQMNIDQCRAASHDQYDASFCMAEHVVREPAERCFGWILP